MTDPTSRLSTKIVMSANSRGVIGLFLLVGRGPRVDDVAVVVMSTPAVIVSSGSSTTLPSRTRWPATQRCCGRRRSRRPSDAGRQVAAPITVTPLPVMVVVSGTELRRCRPTRLRRGRLPLSRVALRPVHSPRRVAVVACRYLRGVMTMSNPPIAAFNADCWRHARRRSVCGRNHRLCGGYGRSELEETRTGGQHVGAGCRRGRRSRSRPRRVGGRC